MEAIFTKLIDQLNSSVFVLLVILGSAFYATFWIARLVEQFTHHKNKLEKFDGLSEKLVELRTKVDLIYQNTNPNKVVAAFSPIALTPAGKEIAAKLNADAIFRRYVDKLTTLVEESAPKTAYDVQAKSMEITRAKMLGCLNADEVNAVKAEAFNRGLIAEDIMSIFGVLLRDHLLAAKGLSVADADKKPDESLK